MLRRIALSLHAQNTASSRTMKQIRIGGRLVDLSSPLVMAIVNITPDSFFERSRAQTQDDIRAQIQQHIAAGADVIDLGAYSSRPGADYVSDEDEFARLKNAFPAIREFSGIVPFSIDTFRSSIVQRVFDAVGDVIVNDITGGYGDDAMFDVVARCGLPYIAMHMRGTPQTMQSFVEYSDLVGEIIVYFATVLEKAKMAGIADVIVDPGFGFSKTLEQNYELMSQLEKLKILERPVLVGISRKSMVHKLLGIDARAAVNGTTALHAVALHKGADILRVHDVKEAKEAVAIAQALKYTVA